jgi:tetratricopeptide (TPR) repeat protein
MITRIYKDTNAKRGEALFRLQQGNTERGRQLAAEARALFATMPADDESRGKLTASMAELMLELGELAEAERLIKESLEIDKGAIDDNERGTRYMFLAQMLTKQQRWDEAEEYVLKAIDAPFGEIQCCHGLLAQIRAAKRG